MKLIIILFSSTSKNSRKTNKYRFSSFTGKRKLKMIFGKNKNADQVGGVVGGNCWRFLFYFFLKV